jgi:DNA-binding beta-propeller fold protein YncE
MESRQQRRARRRADGAAGVVLREAGAAGRERVECGRLEIRLAVRAQIAVAQIVGLDQDDVGPRGRRLDGGMGRRDESGHCRRECRAHHGLMMLRFFAMRRNLWVVLLLSAVGPAARGAADHHFLYVAEPGIRNYVEYGGVGVLVYDIDAGYKFVRRIPSQEVPAGAQPENVKGIAASAATGRLYVTTIRRLMAFDLTTDKKLWDREMPGGADRLAISPDGKTLYVPTLEGPQWNVVDAITSEVRTAVVTNSGAHNTIYGPDGKRVYLAGLKSPMLKVADPATHTVVQDIGPFASVIRPFTINGSQTRAYVNVNDLLGFEVGDMKTGKVLQHVEVQGYEKGAVKRHGCPSHGIALSPDEKELWLSDGHNSAVHVFDMTKPTPAQIATIKTRDQPGWITFRMDGKHVWPSTGEIVDAKTKKIVAALTDEEHRVVQSEKVVEVVFDGKKVVRTGDQFGMGQKR